jgi:hypothetical protein
LDLIVSIDRTSSYIEEVFAVRSSLLNAREIGFISPDRQQDLELFYKEDYGKDIPIFSLAYDAFDFVAGKIGEAAATGIIHYVLETLNPSHAFLDLISGMCKTKRRVPTNDFLWSLPDELTAFLAKLSVKQACDFFGMVLDKDDSLYGRASLLDYVAAIKQEWSAFSQDINDDFTKLLFGSETPILFTNYIDFIRPASLLKHADLTAARAIITEVKYGSIALVLEAILQQLTTGIGLLCPFWIDSPPTCCSSRNRALLEKVWSRTSPNPSKCKLWKRMGCLAKDGVAPCDADM